MDCDGVRKSLEMWLDDEMDATSRQEFSAHLAACGPCKEKVQGETKLETAIRERVPREKMPPDTWRRLRQRLAREANPWRRGLAIASAFAAAAALFFGFSFWWEWRLHKPDLEVAAMQVQRQYASGSLKIEMETNSADDLETWLNKNLGMQVSLQQAMSGRCAGHEVKFMGASVVPLGDVRCACLAYRCCGQPVTVYLLPMDKMDRFPEMKEAIAKVGDRLEDRFHTTNIEVRRHGPWVACIVGDHPIADLAAMFEGI